MTAAYEAPATKTLGAMDVTNGVPSISAESPQAACSPGGAVLTAAASISDSATMGLGDIRTARFILTVSDDGTPIGTDSKTVSWTRTPFSKTTGPDTEPFVVVLPQGGAPKLVEVDLVAEYWDGVADETPDATSSRGILVLTACQDVGAIPEDIMAAASGCLPTTDEAGNGNLRCADTCGIRQCVAIGLPAATAYQSMDASPDGTEIRCFVSVTTSSNDNCHDNVALGDRAEVPEMGWIYCYNSECSTSASIHAALWVANYHPSSAYGADFSAYRQWYAGNYGQCPDANCDYGDWEGEYNGVSAFTGDTIWNYDPRRYLDGSECHETHYNSGQWQCAAEGGFGAYAILAS